MTSRPAGAIRTRVLGRGSTTLVTNLVLLGTGIITSALASRALAPIGRGEYVAWQSWAGTIGILTLGGLPQVLVLAEPPGRHRLGELSAPLVASLCAAILVMTALAALARPRPALLIGFALIVVATQVAAVTSAEAQRMGRMTFEFNVARAVPACSGLLAMAVLISVGADNAGTWLVAVGAGQSLAALAWLAQTAERRRPATMPVREALRRSLALAPGNCITMLQYRFDLLAVAMLFPAWIVAFYAVGTAAQTAVLTAGQSTGMLWFASHHQSRADQRDRRRQLRTELRRSATVAAVVGGGLAATSRFWVPAVYGDAFRPATPVVVVLCAVAVLQSMDYLLAHECLMAGLGNWAPLYRMPALLALTAGLVYATIHNWAAEAIAVLPGLGYALSSAAFLLATRARSTSTPSLDQNLRAEEVRPPVTHPTVHPGRLSG